MKIKIYTYLLFSFIVTLSILSTVGCKKWQKNKCESVLCANKGTCSDGSCVCPSGYEGSHCEILSRDKYVGAYQVQEKGTVTPQRSYPVAIEAGEHADEVSIINVYNYFQTRIKAIVNKDSILIPNQQYEGKIIFGKGWFQHPTSATAPAYLNVQYEVIDYGTQLVDDFGYYSQVDSSKHSVWQKQ